MKVLIWVIILFANIQFSFAQDYPEGFQIETVITAVEMPGGMVHSELGISYIWDLQGYVWSMQDDVLADEPMIDIQEEVGFWVDHGLLSVALDPDFESNGYIYLYYVVDRHHLLYFGTDEYDSEADEYENATIGRLTRFQVDVNNLTTLLNDNRTVLVGQTKENGIPICTTSHGVGTVLFGTDKSMFLTVGDGNMPGTSYNGEGPPPEGGYDLQALEDGILKAEENVGAFRAQFLDTYCGKLLRLDKNTGLGLPSNPFYDAERPDDPRSKIWALGLRNPFRFTLVPQTGSTDITEGNPGDFMLGDVGDWDWEEMNLVNAPRMNFGWPIYQGPSSYSSFITNYAIDVTRPLDDNCPQAYLYFQDAIVDPKLNGNEVWPSPCGGELSHDDFELFVHERPLLSYRNWISTPPSYTVLSTFDEQGNPNFTSISELDIEGNIDFYGAASVAGTYYSGAAYPEEYYHSYFHADFARWLKVFHYNELNELVKVEHWDDAIGNIVHVSLNPNNECIYVANVFPGEIRKISFEGNLRPVVELTPDTTYGVGPLAVNFDASNSYDPEGTDLSFFWDFGDGETSDLEVVSHVFSGVDSNPESFHVSLLVTDADEESNTGKALVSINNTPPSAEIISIPDDYLYSLGGVNELALVAELTDNESPVSELEVRWRVFLHHNNHFHLEQTYNQHEATAFLEPLGCGIEIYWYRIQLTVTDPQGLRVVLEREVFPNCDSEREYPEAFILYPNPASYNLIVQLNESPGDWAEIDILDVSGRLVKSEYMQIEENQRTLKISVANLAEGGYVLLCRTAFWRKKRRFIVARE